MRTLINCHLISYYVRSSYIVLESRKGGDMENSKFKLKNKQPIKNVKENEIVKEIQGTELYEKKIFNTSNKK